MMQQGITCETFITFLDDYIDGSLSVGERERFEQHLAGCRSCVAYLTSYRETIRLACAAAEEPQIELDVPEDLIAAVLDSMRR